jgi:transcriptional regulator with XRE-family HTH domain
MSGPSKRDREKLRERVKTQLRKQGRSQKDLEDGSGLAAGTLTRVFNGRRHLDAEVAEWLCRELGQSPEELFAGTTFLEFLSVVSADVAEGSDDSGAETVDAASSSAPTDAAPPQAHDAPAASPVVDADVVTSAPHVEPARAPAVAPAPASRPVDLPPPPEPEPRFRKRDLPLKAVQWIVGLATGRKG